MVTPKRKTAASTKVATKQMRCPTCGKEKASSSTNFYMTHSSLYRNNKNHDGKTVYPFCKDCMVAEFKKNYKILDDVYDAITITCMKYDIPFDESTYNGMVNQLSESDHPTYFKTYMQKLNSFGYKNGCEYEFIPKGIVDVNIDMAEVEITERYVMSENSQVAMKDVLMMMEADPFMGYTEFDKDFLYIELLKFLDEDTLEDPFKLSQVIQLVTNNNQVRTIDLEINKYMENLSVSSGDVKSLTEIKNKIVMGTDKIAKENAISVKNRSDKRAGRSTLTYKMKELRELNFEDAEADWYDQMKAKGMSRVAKISSEAIWSQLQFDENDYSGMIKEQKELIQTLYDKLDKLKEENRQLYAKQSSKAKVM
jgi:hypothetical protein